MLTRCPACATVFRVVSWQLDARQGLVRCGRCTEVFNARWHAMETAPGSNAEPATPLPPSSTPPPAIPPGERSDALMLSAVTIDEAAKPDTERAQDEPRRPRTLAATPSAAASDSGVASQGPQTPEPRRAQTPAPASEPPAAALPPTRQGAATAARAGPAPAVPDSNAALSQRRPPSSTDDVDSGSATRHTKPAPRASVESADDVTLVSVRLPNPRRALLVRVATAMAALLLIGQGWLHYGERMLEHDAVRDVAGSVCLHLGCTLPDRRAVDALSLAGARVAGYADDPGALRVDISLINRAHFAQPPPSLEVTLTDRHGRTLGRRVFGPADYLPDALTLMDPGVLTHGALVLAGPPESALGFEVRVVDTTPGAG